MAKTDWLFPVSTGAGAGLVYIVTGSGLGLSLGIAAAAFVGGCVFPLLRHLKAKRAAAAGA